MDTSVERYEATRAGWLFFAGILLLLHGTVDVINGLWAIDRGGNTVETLGFESLESWGWIHLFVGLAVGAVGVCIILGQAWAVMTGIVLGSIGLIANVFWLPVEAMRFSALISLVLIVLALYGLVVYGPSAEPDGAAPPEGA